MTEAKPKPWNPFDSWRDQKIPWVRVNISSEDLQRFTKRSDLMGLLHSIGFLGFLTASGAWAYWSFQSAAWIQMALALYIHGLFYGHFGDALHELGHNTVFASRWLNKLFITIYGLLAWTWNPYFYSLSHIQYHHRYTLYQESDGEDVPNYVGKISLGLLLQLFFRVFAVRAIFQNFARLVTLTPTSKGWRGRSWHLDNWERFILGRASDRERRRIKNFSIVSLLVQVFFLAICFYYQLWFLPVLITLAPFYGPGFHGFICGTHQHAGCDANSPDFRESCGDMILDPLSSFLYWHMEFHIEHHMFAAIPCYNLKKFSHFVADQLPPKQGAIPRLLELPKTCLEKYGTREDWYCIHGRYKWEA